jgi:hypothetical protein
VKCCHLFDVQIDGRLFVVEWSGSFGFHQLEQSSDESNRVLAIGFVA